MMKGNKFSRIIFILVAMVSLAACNPFKVTDPADPSFDPMKFEFEDYGDPKKISAALREIFPKGTSIEEIEKVLLDIEGVEKFERGIVIENVRERNKLYKITYIYIYTPPTFIKRLPLIIRATMALSPMEVYRIIVDVDENNKSLNIMTTY